MVSLGDSLKNVWLVSSDRPSSKVKKFRYLGRASKLHIGKLQQRFLVLV